MNLSGPLYFLLLTLTFFSCSKNAPSVCPADGVLYQQAAFPIGAAVNPIRLNHVSEYNRIAKGQFNSWTTENIMKPENMHPEPDVYNWIEADALADSCRQYGIRLHGHTLLWHQALPDWIVNGRGTRAEWRQILKDHVRTIVGHFKGRVASWDVVNEAFNEDGTLRNSIWRQLIGDDYIELAFAYAREADPNVLLFYNDYNLESNPQKRAAVHDLLNRLRSRGIQVDGIGLQMHVRLHEPNASEMTACFSEFAADHYKIHLSELDISVNPLSKVISDKASLFTEQAQYLEQIIRCYQQVPAALQYGITFWGVSDADSWIPAFYNREDYPLLYDQQYVPKPAYCLLKKIL